MIVVVEDLNVESYGLIITACRCDKDKFRSCNNPLRGKPTLVGTFSRPFCRFFRSRLISEALVDFTIRVREVIAREREDP